MNETNNHANSASQQPAITVRLNHPKLAGLPLLFCSDSRVSDVQLYVAEHTLLGLFSNYRLEVAGKPVSPRKTLGELLPIHASQLEFDVVFQHYNYATALHHSEAVSKALRQPHRLALWLRANPKESQSVLAEPESLSRELVPTCFKITKSHI
jgi:hypothetical protein